jgi:hypothetical protein
MPAASPIPLLVDPYQTETDEEEEAGAAHASVPALPRPEEAEFGEREAVEVQLADGVWYRGKLVGRVAGSKPLRWRVHFDDGVLREDIWLANPETPVRFDASAYGPTVEVRLADEEWRLGRLVALVRGDDRSGVAFEGGGCVEDVRLGGPDVRYVVAGRGGAGPGGGRGRGGGVLSRTAEEAAMPVDAGMNTRLRKKQRARLLTEAELLEKSDERAGTERSGRDTAGGGATFASSASRKRPAQAAEEEEREVEEESPKERRLGKAGRVVRGGRQVCETCDKSFVCPSSLAVHMRTHSEVKPYVCETCGRAFSQSGNLGRHRRTHSGEKPHVCDTCGMTCSTSGQLTVHMRAHSGERPHVCGTCGKAFSRSSHLDVHMRTHAGGRPKS